MTNGPAAGQWEPMHNNSKTFVWEANQQQVGNLKNKEAKPNLNISANNDC